MDQNYKYENVAQDIKQKKKNVLPQKPTRAQMLMDQAVKQKAQTKTQEPQKNFKLKRFANIESKVHNNRTPKLHVSGPIIENEDVLPEILNTSNTAMGHYRNSQTSKFIA